MFCFTWEFQHRTAVQPPTERPNNATATPHTLTHAFDCPERQCTPERCSCTREEQVSAGTRVFHFIDKCIVPRSHCWRPFAGCCQCVWRVATRARHHRAHPQADALLAFNVGVQWRWRWAMVIPIRNEDGLLASRLQIHRHCHQRQHKQPPRQTKGTTAHC